MSSTKLVLPLCQTDKKDDNFVKRSYGIQIAVGKNLNNETLFQTF